MQNIKATVTQDNKLVLEIDLSEVVSTTSKGNDMIATTASWEKIPEVPGLTLNLACVRSNRGGRR